MTAPRALAPSSRLARANFSCACFAQPMRIKDRGTARPTCPWSCQRLSLSIMLRLT
jgi:hypothetical protein